jgi:hypothetical protein
MYWLGVNVVLVPLPHIVDRNGSVRQLGGGDGTSNPTYPQTITILKRISRYKSQTSRIVETDFIYLYIYMKIKRPIEVYTGNSRG